MTGKGLDIVILGLSLSSSWGNGHATTYRALVEALARRGHDVLFLERDVPWYAAHRDLATPTFCSLAFYDGLARLGRHRKRIAAADAVIVGSYVPDGIAVGDWVLANARGVTAFYDIDTPVTLAAVEQGTCAYLSRTQIARYNLYLSFTGGPTLDHLRHLGARSPDVLYCSADTRRFRPLRSARRWDLGYLGTYSADRQPALERLLIEPAHQRPDLSFVVAGAQFPDTVAWPGNVTLIPHLSPLELPSFFAKLRWTLNLTRADMIRAGWSPSVRLFEAAACATPIISDAWAGIEEILEPEVEIVVAETSRDVLDALAIPEQRRRGIGAAARSAILAGHTPHHRAADLEGLIRGALDSQAATVPPLQRVSGKFRNRSNLLTFQSRRPP